MQPLGLISGAERAESARLPWRVPGLEAFTVPGVVEFTRSKKFAGHQGFGEDEDFLIENNFSPMLEKTEGKL